MQPARILYDIYVNFDVLERIGGNPYSRVVAVDYFIEPFYVQEIRALTFVHRIKTNDSYESYVDVVVVNKTF